MPLRPTDPVTDAEAAALFADLTDAPALLLAVSGGPDSTALMLLAARWRAGLKQGPKLIAATVDHGLRPEAKKEAAAVAKLARKLSLAHTTLRWRGKKPATGLQQAARAARYALLAEAARKAKATCILTAHTLDDQAETVLIRMSRGSGVTGLGAMQRIAVIPGHGTSDQPAAGQVILLRPLLTIPKTRLVATAEAAGVAFADDPSNRDPRFTRARLRGLMPRLAEEGLDASRLAQLARRLKRADAALEAVVAVAETELVTGSGPAGVRYDRSRYGTLPSEIALRLLGRGIARYGTEGQAELGKLEDLQEALGQAHNLGTRFRRTLAGAIVTLTGAEIVIEPAPPRRRKTLTTHRGPRARRVKSR